MALSDRVPLYPYSLEDARRSEEVSLWRDSFRENIRCKEAIEQAIRRSFDGMYLQKDCAKGVLEEFGFKRVQFVLANTLQELRDDGRFSRDNKQWSRTVWVPPDKVHNCRFCVGSHPAVLDGFVDEYRRAYQALGLFRPEQCEGNTGELDYEGRVLVMKPETLHESYWKPEYQLWYAHDGFGCSPHAIGRSIRCTCLGDGEMMRWNRSDFIGPIQEEFLPDWAMEKLEQLRPAQRQETPAMGGMEMK